MTLNIGPHTIILKERRTLCKNTFEYVFERPKNFDFIAGQYVILDIADGEFHDDQPTFRSLSIASPPHENVLRFAMRNSASGFKRSIAALSTGDTVQIKGPLGHFTLPEDKSVPLVFLIGGIGVTPARSMLLQEEYEKSERTMILMYSNLNPRTAAYYEELAELNLSNYTCINTMSHMHEAPKELWNGEEGLIREESVKKYCDLSTQTLYYVVGTKGFINAMKAMLTDECHIDNERIIIDNFG